MLSQVKEYLAVREMQVKNFNEMKAFFPACIQRYHTLQFQIFEGLEKKEFFYFFSLKWNEQMIKKLSKKLESYLHVILVLPEGLEDYPKENVITVKKIRVGGKYGSKPINKNSE